MKHDAVVKAAVSELGDALDMAWRKIGPELDDDVAAGREGKGQAVGVGHKSELRMKASKEARFRHAATIAPEQPRP